MLKVTGSNVFQGNATPLSSLLCKLKLNFVRATLILGSDASQFRDLALSLLQELINQAQTTGDSKVAQGFQMEKVKLLHA
jgi:hypothetical protein